MKTLIENKKVHSSFNLCLVYDIRKRHYFFNCDNIMITCSTVLCLHMGYTFLNSSSIQKLLPRFYKMSPKSEQIVDERAFSQRTSRPFYKKKFIRRYQDLADKYSVLTSQIVHDGHEV